MSANVLVLSGYGLNCEEETLHAFEYVGLQGKIRHINDLIESPEELKNVQVLVVPGGFSYGDDTGSGNAFAQKMKLALKDHLHDFVRRDTLTLGICNGCQIIANLGLIPGLDHKYGERLVAVTHNMTARYQCRWVDVQVNQESQSPWLQGADTMVAEDECEISGAWRRGFGFACFRCAMGISCADGGRGCRKKFV